ncbi:MAG: hypothetical protein KGN36_14640 [Acidobacteriota bacterium]|nr:hypothetical protein [Acidobacteriota bacterium]
MSRTLLLLCALAAFGGAQDDPEHTLPPWTPGVMEIHQISTGRGNAALFILPDGTTMLVDAGAAPDGIAETDPHPDSSRSPGEWIARYIRRHLPAGVNRLDWVLITHFQPGHIGGLTAVGEDLAIGTLIDRGWPDYNYPAPDAAPAGYRSYVVGKHADGIAVERFLPGSGSQIHLVHRASGYPTFDIRNIAGNGEVWTGEGDSTRALFPPLDKLAPRERPTEDMCSLGIRVSYGRFRYFTGGDLPGTADPGYPAWQAMEAAVAPAVGKVDAHLVNRHGATGEETEAFLSALQSLVLIVPSWAPGHPAADTLKRILNSRLPPDSRQVFATDLRPAARLVLGERARGLAAPPGHIVLRVAYGGESYRVYVLDASDEADRVLAMRGPFRAASL